MDFTRFMWNNNFRPEFIFTHDHFYFDSYKLFVIESESLLERKFCFSGELFKNLVGSKKKIVVWKKVIDNRNRLKYVVRLVAAPRSFGRDAGL